MKKILLCFMLLCGVVFLGGCSVTSASTYVNTDVSSIFITVTYDKENLTEVGVESQEEIDLIKAEIENKSATYMNELLIKYRSLVNTLGANGVLTSNEKIIYKNHLNLYTGWDGETYLIELRFYTKTASRIFIKYGGETKSTETSNNLFVTKVLEEYSEIFASTPNNLIRTSVNDYFNEGVAKVIKENFGAESEDKFKDIVVNYLFLTGNKRVHSNGAVLETSEGSLHFFTDSDEGNVFMFYKVEANRYAWYLLALTITMAFIAVMLVVIYFKKGEKPNSPTNSQKLKNDIARKLFMDDVKDFKDDK